MSVENHLDSEQRAHSELLVAVVQMSSVDSVEKNFESIWSSLEAIKKQNTEIELISFPENALFFRISVQDSLQTFSSTDKIFEKLASWCQQNSCAVHIGSVAIQNPNQKKALNSTLWISDKGEISFPYSKIHLFDVDVAGEKPIRESDFFQAGSAPSIVHYKTWSFGLSICYDIRFSELYYKYAISKVDVILVPSAFLSTTGQAHWHSLLRARAIECQSYVMAAAQVGPHHSKKSQDVRHCYGHSMIISPWGEILAESQDENSKLLIIKLTKDRIDKVRKQIPMMNHRKLK